MILEPHDLGRGVRAKNRVWVAPMTNGQSHADGSLSDDELEWLDMRARGGFGVVETCAAHVAKDGQGWAGELGVYSDALLPGLERLARRLRERGAVALVQLFHGGVRSPSSITGTTPWSASDVQSTAGERPRPATEDDVARVIAQFRDAALLSQSAGFHGIELHGAHGYLLSQFLSVTLNRRTDAWGGSLEGRARLFREVLRRVRGAVRDDFLVGFRISAEDYGNAQGLDLDESLQVARWLCEDGADFVHVSLWDWRANSKKRPHEHTLQAFRAAVPARIPIVAAGGIWTTQDACAVMDLGADAVALARAAIANPDWPRRAADPDWRPRRPPLRREELIARGLSPAFADSMKRWPGFVEA